MPMIRTYAELGRGPMVGDRVLISESAPTHRYWSPLMQKFISTVMTIREVYDDFDCIKMMEDVYEHSNNTEPGWDWFLPMIEGVIIDDIDEDPAVWTSDFTIDDLLTL